LFDPEPFDVFTDATPPIEVRFFPLESFPAQSFSAVVASFASWGEVHEQRDVQVAGRQGMFIDYTAGDGVYKGTRFVCYIIDRDGSAFWVCTVDLPNTSLTFDQRRALLDQSIATLRFEPVTSSATPTVPSDVEVCRADQLEYAGGGQTGLLRFVNRGGPCGLAGYPTLIGRKLDGSWVTVLARLEPGAPVSGSPPWTGVFDPSKVAVLAIRPGIETSTRQCVGHALPDPDAQFSGLRVLLPKDAGVIEITDSGTFRLGPCQPHLTSFSYDTTSG
jgi:hypothetical protein